MIQAYRVTTYIAVNDEPKKEYWCDGYGLTEEELPQVITTTYSFQDCFDKQLPTLAIQTNKTSFRKKPYVEVWYDWENVKYYYHFDSITIEKHYEPYDITLDELFKKYSADQCIQYLKERGMTACPILK